MSIRTVQYSDSVDVLWEEVIYTAARLKADQHANDLHARASRFIARISEARTGQYAVWQAEIEAQAGVDDADAVLDDLVIKLGNELARAENGETDTPRWKLYFGKLTPKALARKSLEPEAKDVRSWPASLKSEPEKDLKALAKPVENALKLADERLAARATAEGARREFMAREKTKLVDDLNDLRQALYAELATRVVPKKLARDWPNEFFRKSTSSRSAAEEKTEPKPTDKPEPKP